MDRNKVCNLKNKRPIVALLDLLGRRWALRILWELKDGALTFRALQQQCGRISPTVMSKRITEMRKANILEQTQGEGYSITEDGLQLCNSLMDMNNWAREMTEGGSMESVPTDNLDNKVVYCPLCGSSLTAKVIEGQERYACPVEACGYVFWDNPIPVVAAIVEHDGEIILARNKSWPEKTFGLITGFLEKNETTEEAVAREVKEELGLESISVEFISNYSFVEMNQLLIGFHVKTTGTIVVGEELAEVKRVEIQKMKSWPFGTGFIVREWLEKINTI